MSSTVRNILENFKKIFSNYSRCSFAVDYEMLPFSTMHLEKIQGRCHTFPPARVLLTLTFKLLRDQVIMIES